MAEISEVLAELEPSGDLDRGIETTGQSSVRDEAVAKTSASPLNGSSRG